MKYESDRLLNIAQKVHKKKRLSVSEVTCLSNFTHLNKESFAVSFVKNSALPLSLLLGFLFAVFPEYFEETVSTSPSWTNFSPRLLAGVDYLWNILGEPVEKQNIIYHLPNIVFYSFGILGVKKLLDAVNRRTWLDTVLEAKAKLKESVLNGSVRLSLAEGHSVLFVGRGDFIGMQFVLDHKKSQAVTVSEVKPDYSDIWNYYDVNKSYDDLKEVLKRVADKETGEYIFFPVKDDQIFLPSPAAYDLSPHKLDILCQNLRNIEKELRWKPKRIIIIGDKYHHSFVRSEDKKGVIRGSDDVVSLDTIAKRYKFVTLIDPTDIVLKKVLEIAQGRRIVFRATKEGMREYKSRFYKRIEELGFKSKRKKDGVLTIGYDLFEDQTEQQTLSRKIDDYLPVVLSKNVYDALKRNGYKDSEFLYVPDLVLTHLKLKAGEQ